MKKIGLAILLAAIALPAWARTELTSQRIFYLAPEPAGRDGLNCGPEATPCATPNWVYDDLQRNYDLRCNQVVIQHLPGIYNYNFIAFGPLLGLCGSAWMQQVVLRGDVSNNSNVTIRPITGIAAISAQNGAVLFVEGMVFDGSAYPGEMLVGTTWNSVLGLGANTFGCNPGKIDIQPSISSAVYVYGSYTIDQSYCGPAGPVLNTIGSTTTGSPMMGLGNPGGVVPGMTISAACAQPNSNVVAIDSAWVTMNQTATCSNGGQSVSIFTPRGGCSQAHTQQDSLSLLWYLGGTVTLKNAPCYNGTAFMMLDWATAGVLGVTFKGSITGGAVDVFRNPNRPGSWLFSQPADNHIVFTP